MRIGLRSGVVLGTTLVFSSMSFAYDNSWKDLGEIGGPVFWAAGLGSSLIQDGHLGLNHAARTADGFIVALALDEAISVSVRERRPYGDDLNSFPSTHAALSFEIAAAQSYYHPKQAVYWYGAAALISYSRIPAHKHFWQDIVGGAFLGYGAGQLSVSSHSGWLLAPLVADGHLGGSAVYTAKF